MTGGARAPCPAVPAGPIARGGDPLPADLDGSLFGEGDYTLEVLRGKLSRIKLREQDAEALAGMAEKEEQVTV